MTDVRTRPLSAGANAGPERSTLAARFARLGAEGRTALVAYLTAGFPSAGDTVPLMEAVAAAGADVLELGIPFSDPLADGPTIQRSSFLALERGMTVRHALDLLAEFSARSEKLCLLLSFEQVADLGGNAFLGLDQSHADCIAEGDCVGAAMALDDHTRQSNHAGAVIGPGVEFAA